ncbi:hypothetical protein SGRA_2789 [Saprospira grandis str. Lewin]|uniref:Uncharacterized protein n=1 Tax=Saprospira grandis (strain Lewin) TaxID=984262 RepID=H6LA49_SAPGL|nr:hypothetical protein SGRA_2789 [Saprospira grandis str. Lewin]
MGGGDFAVVFWGLPRPLGGSGHCAARRFARPCSGKSRFGLPPLAALLQPLSRGPSALCRRLRRLLLVQQISSSPQLLLPCDELYRERNCF